MAKAEADKMEEISLPLFKPPNLEANAVPQEKAVGEFDYKEVLLSRKGTRKGRTIKAKNGK